MQSMQSLQQTFSPGLYITTVAKHKTVMYSQDNIHNYVDQSMTITKFIAHDNVVLNCCVQKKKFI